MNYYELLQVTPSASAEVIKNAYKAMAKKYHPDLYKGNRSFAEEKMKLLNEAISILESAEKRREYNIENNFPDISNDAEQNEEYMKNIDDFLNYSDSQTPPDITEIDSFDDSEDSRSLFDYEEELEKAKSSGRKSRQRIGKWYYIVIAGLIIANIVIIALIIGNFSTALLNSFKKENAEDTISDEEYDDIEDYIEPQDWNDAWENDIIEDNETAAATPTQEFVETYLVGGNEPATAETTTEKTALALPPTAATTGKKLPAPTTSKPAPVKTTEAEKITESETLPEYTEPEEPGDTIEFPYEEELTTEDYLHEIAPGMITEDSTDEFAEPETEYDSVSDEADGQIEEPLT